jgi:hypothetical protein
MILKAHFLWTSTSAWELSLQVLAVAERFNVSSTSLAQVQTTKNPNLGQVKAQRLHGTKFTPISVSVVPMHCCCDLSFIASWTTSTTATPTKSIPRRDILLQVFPDALRIFPSDAFPPLRSIKLWPATISAPIAVQNRLLSFLMGL